MPEDNLEDLRCEFSEFELSLGKSDVLDILKKAISSYQEIANDDLGSSERDKKIANNILNSYARKFISEARKIKSDPRGYEHTFHEYWANLTAQFLGVEPDLDQEIRDILQQFLVNWSVTVPFKS